MAVLENDRALLFAPATAACPPAKPFIAMSTAAKIKNWITEQEVSMRGTVEQGFTLRQGDMRCRNLELVFTTLAATDPRCTACWKIR